MVHQEAFQKIISQYFDVRRHNQKSYSVRAFSRELGVSASAINEIMHGTRRVSESYVTKIAKVLNFTDKELREIINDDKEIALRDNIKVVPPQIEKKKINKKKLEENQIEYISNWIHFAILSLLKTKNFRYSPGRMAKRLGVDIEEVKIAIIRLQQLSLITVDPSGDIKRTEAALESSEDIISKALQKAHLNDLALVENKLKDVDVSLRDYSSFTFCANPEKIKIGKQIIRQAQDLLEEVMKDENAQEVYRVCMYLFPLTVTEEKNEN